VSKPDIYLFPCRDRRGAEMIKVAEGIYLLDCLFAGLPGQCGVFLLRGRESALIDCGPSLGVGHVIAGLESAGIARGDIRYILLTHTHMDHAGGASLFLEHYPGAQVLVDEKTSWQLADPARLVRSASRALGDIAPYYGTMSPIPAERMIPLGDGQVLEIGGERSLRALHTPGHSSGHFAFFEEGAGALFCGDALGHLIMDSGHIFPATPAPEFDLELSMASAERLAALAPRLLLFPHFGATGRAAEVFDRFAAQLKLSRSLAEGFRDEEEAPVLLAAALLQEMPPLKEGEERLIPGILKVNAGGVLHHLRKLEKG